MQKLIHKFKKVIIISLTIIAVLTFIGIYIPMKAELEKETIENFKLEAKLNMHIFEQYVNNCMTGASTLSSRSLTMDKIIAYNKKELTLEKLREYMQPGFRESAAVLNELVAAYRIVDHRLVACYGSIAIPREDYDKDIQVSTCEITDNTDGTTTIKIYSPIMSNKKVLGYDVVIYSGNEIIQVFKQENTVFTILDKEEAKSVNDNKNIVYYKEGRIYIKTDTVYYLKQITKTSQYMCISIAYEELFDAVDRISFTVFAGFLIGILLTVIFTNWYIVSHTESFLNMVEDSRLKYKEYATKDTLTGAYSRLYLEQFKQDWSKNNKFNEFCVCLVMIDIDNFKQINDENGHAMGDEALKYVVRTFQTSLREDDIIIRLGGDEFLILLHNCKESLAEDIIKRVMEQLKTPKDFPIPIFLSYGIEEIREAEQLEEAMAHADQKMYHLKKGKNE